MVSAELIWFCIFYSESHSTSSTVQFLLTSGFSSVCVICCIFLRLDIFQLLNCCFVPFAPDFDEFLFVCFICILFSTPCPDRCCDQLESSSLTFLCWMGCVSHTQGRRALYTFLCRGSVRDTTNWYPLLALRNHANRIDTQKSPFLARLVRQTTYRLSVGPNGCFCCVSCSSLLCHCNVLVYHLARMAGPVPNSCPRATNTCTPYLATVLRHHTCCFILLFWSRPAA